MSKKVAIDTPSAALLMEEYSDTLTDTQKNLIADYTRSPDELIGTGRGYKSWNTALRNNTLTDDQKRDVEIISDILIHAPKIDALTHRGISFDNVTDFHNYLSDLEEGNLFHDAAFISTSLHEEIVNEGFQKYPFRIKFDIYSKHGVYLHSLSIKDEKEVLFDKSTIFIVKSIKWISDNLIHIILEDE